VGGPEGVVHIDVGHGRQLPGKVVFGLTQLRVFLGGLVLDSLFPVEAEVLQQHAATRLEGIGLGFRVRSDAVGGEDHLLAEQLGQPFGHRFQREPRFRLAFWTAQVAHQDQRAAVVENMLDGRQGLDDAVVAGDVAVLIQRHVEVTPHQDLFAFHVNVNYCLLSHNPT